MIHASLFSGIGGPEVAAAMLGWENAFHCEINPFGRSVLEYWFPDSESYDDITKTDFTKWRGRIDVLTGGFPCQPFSYAGKRGGREDERYLWPEMLRVIQEVRPTWVVGENVAGITTMVEGGVLAELGEEASLFAEGDSIHRYELVQSFTIERICSDLEHIGYSVQPMLIPAAAVGAPHRRDRVFIIAHVADASDIRCGCTTDGRAEEEVRSEAHGQGSDAQCSISTSTTNCGRFTSYTDCPGFQESQLSGWRPDSEETGTGIHDRTQRPCCDGRDVADSQCSGLERKDKSGDSEGGERMRVRRDSTGYDWAVDPELLPENRWRHFPTVSPVHRGNDGLPLRMDDLAVPFSKWRTESLKAYGNAIVPQVMYRIFQAIEQTNGNIKTTYSNNELASEDLAL